MTDEQRVAWHRHFYADLMTASARAGGSALHAAFLSTPREAFVGPGPWDIFAGGAYIRTPTADPAFIYQDVLVRLKGDINNGQPSLHALCLAALSPHAGERAIHVGAGTGYYTAILAHLVGVDGRVDAFEIDSELADRARAAFTNTNTANVALHAASAVGRALPEADVIYVNAGATHPPPEWLDALAIGGRLLFPLTPPAGPGAMLLVTRAAADRYDGRFVCAAMFIPCLGARDETAGAALAEAFRRGDAARVRSLHRGTPPDTSSWYAGDGWWLSTSG
jgi:protein-L-isoaspartate(D-aspartate) O-methyltransferase